MKANANPQTNNQPDTTPPPSPSSQGTNITGAQSAPSVSTAGNNTDPNNLPEPGPLGGGMMSPAPTTLPDDTNANAPTQQGAPAPPVHEAGVRELQRRLFGDTLPPSPAERPQLSGPSDQQPQSSPFQRPTRGQPAAPGRIALPRLRGRLHSH